MKKILQRFYSSSSQTLFYWHKYPWKLLLNILPTPIVEYAPRESPRFYANLNNQTDVLHLSIHPSLPYPNCLLHQQNASDNDARTNYYSIFGSTPRIVVNGNVVSASTNYGDPSIFTPYQSLSTPASLRIVQEKFGTDSIRTTVIAKTESVHSLGSLSLFVCLAEDTVFYTGKWRTHAYWCFRKSLSPVSGISMNLHRRDSLVYTFTTPHNTIWNFSRIYSMAILQESGTKNVIQVEAVPKYWQYHYGFSRCKWTLQYKTISKPHISFDSIREFNLTMCSYHLRPRRKITITENHSTKKKANHRTFITCTGSLYSSITKWIRDGK